MPGENPVARLGQAMPPNTSPALTVRVLMVHHIQVIFIRFHISQQIVRGDIAALCLLIVCTHREKEINSSPSATQSGPHPPCPAPACQAVPEPDGSAPHRCHVPGTCTHHRGGHGGKLSFCNTLGLSVLHLGAAAGPITPIYRINLPVYPISGPSTSEEEREPQDCDCAGPRNVTLVVDQGRGGIHEDVFRAAFSFAAVQSRLTAQPRGDVLQVEAGKEAKFNSHRRLQLPF